MEVSLGHHHHQHHHRQHQSRCQSSNRLPVSSDIVDDECSTDSGCSSGGSTGSAETISQQESGEQLSSAGRSPRSVRYLDQQRSRSTNSRQRLKCRFASDESLTEKEKSCRSWSPEPRKRRVSIKSPTHSICPSEGPDNDHYKRSLTARSLKKAFQSLKISVTLEGPAEKATCQKKPSSQKRILRAPVSYTYVRGLSGLPTQRVPRNAV